MERFSGRRRCSVGDKSALCPHVSIALSVSTLLLARVGALIRRWCGVRREPDLKDEARGTRGIRGGRWKLMRTASRRRPCWRRRSFLVAAGWILVASPSVRLCDSTAAWIDKRCHASSAPATVHGAVRSTVAHAAALRRSAGAADGPHRSRRGRRARRRRFGRRRRRHRLPPVPLRRQPVGLA